MIVEEYFNNTISRIHNVIENNKKSIEDTEYRISKLILEENKKTELLNGEYLDDDSGMLSWVFSIDWDCSTVVVITLYKFTKWTGDEWKNIPIYESKINIKSFFRERRLEKIISKNDRR